MIPAHITNTRGITERILEHIFLGEVSPDRRRRGRVKVKGFHCNLDYNDTVVEIVPGTPIVYVDNITGLFEASVRDKRTHTLKRHTSTFFNQNWSRQKVVDCIADATSNPQNIVRDSINGNNAYLDRKTGVVVVPVGNTVYPIPFH